MSWIRSLFSMLWGFLIGRYTHLRWLDERDREQETVQFSKFSDIPLIITIISLLSIGIVMVYSASIVRSGLIQKNPEFFFDQQLRFMIFGVCLMFVVSRIPYQVWGNFSYVFFGASLILLVLVLSPMGKVVNGSRRWLNVGFFNFQPVEIVKFTWILFLSHYYSNPKLNMGSAKNLIGPAIGGVLAIGALAAQPDFGSAIFLVLLFFASFLLAGGRLIHLLWVCIPTALFGVIMSNRFQHIFYRVNTFLAQFFDDEAKIGYNLKQALISFGSGKWFGVGVGNSSQKSFFLPEAHTDFIFDIYGEEFGLLGVFVLVGLYVYLFLRGFYIARSAPTIFGSHLAALTSIMILMQALINMAMAIGLLPTKGITLPLISYGGSSLIIVCFALGILINVSRRTASSRFGLLLIEWSQMFTHSRKNDHFHRVKPPSEDSP